MKQDFKEADQLTRDLLIEIAGPASQLRKYVYFTEVAGIPKTDLRTIEKLWLTYSNNRFGYSVQRRIYTAQKEIFEKFCTKIGWNVEDGDSDRKRRWFGDSEFIYDLSAPQGHLPLTSALRGTQLLKKIFEHPLWEEEEWQIKKKK